MYPRSVTQISSPALNRRAVVPHDGPAVHLGRTAGLLDGGGADVEVTPGDGENAGLGVAAWTGVAAGVGVAAWVGVAVGRAVAAGGSVLRGVGAGVAA